MIFPTPLEPGILLKRYKRFLADVKLENGTQVTVHCPNSGSMLSCSTPGSPVYISRSSRPQRKYPFTLEMTRENATWVGINTSLTNHLVIEGIKNGDIPELRNPDSIRREVKVSPASRLDVLLTKGTRRIYIEIKSCTLTVDHCAMFPDAVTSRGRVSFFSGSTPGCRFFSPCCPYRPALRKDTCRGSSPGRANPGLPGRSISRRNQNRWISALFTLIFPHIICRL